MYYTEENQELSDWIKDESDRVVLYTRLPKQLKIALENDARLHKRSTSSHLEFILEQRFNKEK
tara:strand:+ start:280 stop:468 length:189 start_codon:yes stop_codon:yes gene_type:complete